MYSLAIASFGIAGWAMSPDISDVIICVRSYWVSVTGPGVSHGFGAVLLGVASLFEIRERVGMERAAVGARRVGAGGKHGIG